MDDESHEELDYQPDETEPLLTPKPLKRQRRWLVPILIVALLALAFVGFIRHCISAYSQILSFTLNNATVNVDPPLLSIDGSYAFQYKPGFSFLAQTGKILGSIGLDVGRVDVAVEGNRLMSIDIDSRFDIDLKPGDINHIKLNNVSYTVDPVVCADVFNRISEQKLHISVISGRLVRYNMLLDVDQVVEYVGDNIRIDDSLHLPPLDYPVAVNIPQTNWTIGIPTCEDHDVAPIGNVSIPPTSLDLTTGTKIPFNYTVDISPELLPPCKSLNELVTDYLTDEAIVYIGGIMDLQLRVPVSQKQMPLPSNPVKSVDVNQVEVGISHGNIDFKANFTGSLEDPGFSVDEFRGKMTIWSGEKLAEIELPWCESHISSGFGMEPHGTIKVAPSLGKMVGKEWNLTGLVTADFVVRSPVVNTTFEGLPLNFSAGVPKENYNVSVELGSVRLIDSKEGSLSLSVDVNITNPTNTTLYNYIEWIAFEINYMNTKIGKIGIRDFMLTETGNVSMVLVLEEDAIFGKTKLEEMVGRYISGQSPDIGIKGLSVSESESVTAMLQNVQMDLGIPQLASLILDSTLHILLSEIELKVYNPIENEPIDITIIEGKASHDGVTLGYVSGETHVTIPPGVSDTPGIPVTVARTGMGADILRKALNGELDVTTQALVKIGVGEFELTVLYEGAGMNTNIRL